MERIFVQIAELQNQTNQQLEFEVENGYLRVRPLRPGKIRQIRLWKVLQCCKKHDSPKWKIRVLIHHQFSGIEISPLHLLSYARIVLRSEPIGTDRCVLCIDGTLEKGIDQWLSLKYLGCMRKWLWTGRSYTQIARAHPKWAIQLRDEEEDPPQAQQLVVVDPPQAQQLVVVPLARDETSLQQKPSSQKKVRKTHSVPVGDSVEISNKRVVDINTPAVQPRRQRVMENKTDHRITNIIPAVEVQEIFRQGRINRGVYGDSAGISNRTGEALEQQQMIQSRDTMVRLLLLALSFMLVCYVHLLL